MKQQLLLVIECLLHFSQWSACNDLTQGSLSYPNFNYEEILTVFFYSFCNASWFINQWKLEYFQDHHFRFRHFFPPLNYKIPKYKIKIPCLCP